MEKKFRIMYERMGDYPGGVSLNANVSRHHMHSYPFMAVYAIVAAWYCVVKKSSMIGKYKKFFDDRLVNGDAFFKFFEGKKESPEVIVNLTLDTDKPYRGLLNRVCWAESNLFIGPSASYRLDDPSQKVDMPPLSMKEAQQKLAEDVKNAWNSISQASIVGDKDQPITFTLRDDSKLENFVDTFLSYINYTKEIYVSRYDDWVAIPVEGREAYAFWLNARHLAEGQKDMRFKFKIKTRDDATTAPKKTVCINGFDSNKECVYGREKNSSGMSEQEKEQFQGNKW